MTIGALEGAIRAALGLGAAVLAQDRNAGWSKNKQEDVAVFSYRRDFVNLWDLGKGSPGLEIVAKRLIRNRKEKVFTIVIVWDGEPAGKTGAVNTSRYITPLDWAVAISLAIHQLSPGDYPALRIIIVDPASHRADYADSLSLLLHLRLALPWISMCQPAVRLPGAMGINRLFVDLMDVGGKLVDGVPIMCDAAKSSHIDPELIRRIWSSFLSKPSTHDDHHAISNLLGPQLLLGETARSNDPAVQALRCVMLTVGLLPSASSGKEALLTEKSCWLKPDQHPAWKTIKKQAGEKLKFIVVDDQWQDGWGEVLCKAFGLDFDVSVNSSDGAFVKISQTPENISVHAASSANVILEKLEKSCEDSRFAFRLDDSEPEAAEILFLDLRLFSGSLASGEVAFVERCLKLARRIVADWGDRLPWPGFSEDELGRIEAWIAKAKVPGNNDPRAMSEYAEALTLFARIIAQIDLSLPIVLFTSTGRRDIIKAFDGYGSIICEFEKPRLPGSLDDDLAARAKEQFNSAVTRALEFLDARLVIKYFFSQFSPFKPPVSNTPPEDHWTIELYIDESGSEIDQRSGLLKEKKRLTVGGLIVIFAPGADPDTFNRELLKYMKKNDLFKGDVKQNLRDKAEQLSSWVLGKAKKNKPEHMSLIKLSGTISVPAVGDGERGCLELNNIGDNLHRNLMAHVIDFAIYHHSRRTIPLSKKVSCRIYLPTRTLPSPNKEYSRELFNTLGIQTVYVGSDRLLFEVRDALNKLHNVLPTNVAKVANELKNLINRLKLSPKKRIRYFNFADARPLVLSVANHYNYASFNPRIDHARAYLLNDFNHAGESGGPRALHLLMDAILSASSRGKDGKAIKKITEDGASGSLYHSLMVMTHAARMYAAGHFVESLAAMADVSVNKPSKIVLTLGSEIKDAAKRINGIGFMSFVKIRKERMGYGNSGNIAQTALKGRILKMEESFEEISDGTSGTCKYYHSDTPRSHNIGDKVTYFAAKGYVSGERIVSRILSHSSHPVWSLINDGRIFVGKVYDLGDRQDVGVELCGFSVRGIVRMSDQCNLNERIYFKATSGDGETFAGTQIRFTDFAALRRNKMVVFGRVNRIKDYGGFISLSGLKMGGLVHYSNIEGATYGNIEEHIKINNDVLVEILDSSKEKERLDFKLIENLTRWYAE